MAALKKASAAREKRGHASETEKARGQLSSSHSREAASLKSPMKVGPRGGQCSGQVPVKVLQTVTDLAKHPGWRALLLPPMSPFFSLSFFEQFSQRLSVTLPLGY